jgi:dTDP-4-dehydrorhamnose 3,5-epimerase
VELSPEAKRAFSVQDYGPAAPIDGVEILELERHGDDGGALTELGRFTGGAHAGVPGFTLRQVNYSELEPGVIKAFHVHLRQTDVWYVPPTDRMLVILVDVRQASPTEGARMRLVLGAGESRLLRIPPGVAHGVKNLGPATGRIVYFTDLHFSPEPSTSDEGRLPWDWAGAEVWDVGRG